MLPYFFNTLPTSSECFFNTLPSPPTSCILKIIVIAIHDHDHIHPHHHHHHHHVEYDDDHHADGEFSAATCLLQAMDHLTSTRNPI